MTGWGGGGTAEMCRQTCSLVIDLVPSCSAIIDAAASYVKGSPLFELRFFLGPLVAVETVRTYVKHASRHQYVSKGQIAHPVRVPTFLPRAGISFVEGNVLLLAATTLPFITHHITCG